MGYQSDLGDEEWDIINAILYALKGGITWRMTFLLGKPFMIILVVGASAEYGNEN